MLMNHLATQTRSEQRHIEGLTPEQIILLMYAQAMNTNERSWKEMATVQGIVCVLYYPRTQHITMTLKATMSNQGLHVPSSLRISSNHALCVKEKAGGLIKLMDCAVIPFGDSLVLEHVTG